MFKRNSLPWSCAAAFALLFGFTIPALPQVQVNRTSDSLFLSTSYTPTSDTITPDDCFTIVSDPGANLALCQEYLAAVKKVTLTLAVDRVVTNASSMNQDGSLQSVDQLKANGVVASCQPLRITVPEQPPFLFGYSVAVNGVNVGTVLPLHKNVSQFCVDPGNLRFGFPQGPGVNPTPGVNTITVTTNGPLPPPIFTEAEWFPAASLEVKAMYPIIMIHGWQAGPWTWGASPSTQTPCGLDTNVRTGKGTRDGGFSFIDPLVSGHYPFDCS